MPLTGTVPFRASPGGTLQHKPLSRMDEPEVICAALYAGQDTSAVQATRRAALDVVRSSVSRGSHSGRRASRAERRLVRRQMIQAGLEANGVPQAYVKFAWLSWLLFLVPQPWSAILSAVLWTVDQLLSESSSTEEVS